MTDDRQIPNSEPNKPSRRSPRSGRTNKHRVNPRRTRGSRGPRRLSSLPPSYDFGGSGNTGHGGVAAGSPSGGPHDDAAREAWADIDVADLIAGGVLDVMPGEPPVPISVWRATGPDEPSSTPHALVDGLTPRIAAILIALYTDVDDLVLDATADPAVAGAAGAGGRRYRPLAGETSYAGETAGLILLRWPPHEPHERSRARPGTLRSGRGKVQSDSRAVGEDPPHLLADLLSVCARVVAPDGYTVAVLASPAAGAYRDHARTLINAARGVHLGYLQHVVAITGTDRTRRRRHETIEPPAETEPDIEPGIKAKEVPLRADVSETPPTRTDHLDLLVFVIRPSPRGSGKLKDPQ